MGSGPQGGGHLKQELPAGIVLSQNSEPPGWVLASAGAQGTLGMSQRGLSLWPLSTPTSPVHLCCWRWALGCPALRLQGAAVFGGYR